MNPVVSWLRAGAIFTVVLFAGAHGAAGHTVSSANSEQTAACSAPEYREFNFWIGDWDVFDVDNPTTVVARTRVDRILDGCVVREDYQGANGLKGQSFSLYDASRKVWHQSWVTNRGQALVIEGKVQGGEMVLNGADRTADGKERQVRGDWKPVEGSVRETAVASIDGGKTWEPWFDLVFRPRANSSGSADAEIVADLDKQYQNAVQRNDAATMDSILADDFVLVTGSGKTYTKADLLKEARGGRVHYDRQDDTDQTVRVWGDTAVITAKLWAKGTEIGKPFDYTLWFSDTYVHTPTGWRYVFGQASLPLVSQKP